MIWLAQSTDNSKWFAWSPRLWGNESGLYYVSPELFDELSIRETYACGTVHKNRKEFPEALKGKHRNMLQGDSLVRKRDELLAVKFYDQRTIGPVSLTWLLRIC